MNRNCQSHGFGTRPVLVGALVFALAGFAAFLGLHHTPAPETAADPAPVSVTSGDSQASEATVEPALAAATPAAKIEAANAAAPAAPAPAAVLPEPTAASRELVAALCQLDPTGVPHTPEQVAAWRHNLRLLIGEGAPAVAAICEFLQKNVDIPFGTANSVGYTSARAAMFDALVQIGGAEGLAGTLQTLQVTADPHEIAALAQNLEKLAPGEYRRAAIDAARDALAMAAGGNLEGRDVAPLFEVFQSYGGDSVATDLKQAARQWNYYSAIALAQLSQGAGIPALVEMAQGASSGSLNALQMLAQMSMQYPEARVALLEQARANKITETMWPHLAPLLAGDLYHYEDSAFGTSWHPEGKRSNSAHVALGNQSFYTAPAADFFTPEEIKVRMALIDELESASTDPAALAALEHSRESLRARDPQPLAAVP